MKNLKITLVVGLAMASLLSIGCSKKSGASDVSATGTTDVVPSVPAPAGLGGSTTTTSMNFAPVSLAEMNAYVGSRPLNNPTNYNLSISLQQVGSSGKYAGTIKLSYYDNGVRYEGNFSAPSGYNQYFPSYGTAKDVGLAQAEYNTWFTVGGKTVFSGFFQDTYGGIVLVIDNAMSVNQGDGQGGGTISGQIWYRNFANTYATQGPERKCWFIYAGPYDCRSNVVIQKSGLYPTDSYRKLGDFQGILKSAVFQ